MEAAAALIGAAEGRRRRGGAKRGGAEPIALDEASTAIACPSAYAGTEAVPDAACSGRSAVLVHRPPAACSAADWPISRFRHRRRSRGARVGRHNGSAELSLEGREGRRAGAPTGTPRARNAARDCYSTHLARPASASTRHPALSCNDLTFRICTSRCCNTVRVYTRRERAPCKRCAFFAGLVHIHMNVRIWVHMIINRSNRVGPCLVYVCAPLPPDAAPKRKKRKIKLNTLHSVCTSP